MMVPPEVRVIFDGGMIAEIELPWLDLTEVNE